VIDHTVAPGVTTPVVPFNVIGIIFILYTTVHTPPLGTVTAAPDAIVIGPKLPAFCDTGIV
jgi:hypothetical protein